MHRALAATAFLIGASVLTAQAQNFDLSRESAQATRETLPAAARAIEENTDAKIELVMDAKSFGRDAHAWSNLRIIANRIVGAVSEVGRDQVGKDALAREVQKVVIMKIADTGEDVVELQGHSLLVRTTASDQAMTVLQNIIIAALEKALHTGHPSTP